MQDNKVLRSSKLTVGWTRKTVATNLDIEVPAGSICVLAGPNGSGKSTILKAMARQLKPCVGKVSVAQEDIWSLSAREFACLVSYVPQTVEPGQDLTVSELVMLGRNPHQRWWSWHISNTDQEVVQMSLEKTHTWDLRYNYLSELSGGERQRAAIAVALAQQPRFMLLDEPTAHLDFKHQLELAELLVELRCHGIGILVVLHDLNLMAAIADYIFLLNKSDTLPSQIVAHGAPQAVLEPGILRQVYDVEVSVLSDSATGQLVYATRARQEKLP
ncbi:MAG: ABC transporter ATP-binding protein [Candidatus Melainabacteria bacterium]|nr:ABC transporter ATP-binding protein [Candidatus Melainabacteria bacterium]